MRIYSIIIVSFSLMFYIFGLSTAKGKNKKVWLGFILAYLPVWLYVLR